MYSFHVQIFVSFLAISICTFAVLLFICVFLYLVFFTFICRLCVTLRHLRKFTLYSQLQVKNGPSHLSKKAQGAVVRDVQEGSGIMTVISLSLRTHRLLLISAREQGEPIFHLQQSAMASGIPSELSPVMRDDTSDITRWRQWWRAPQNLRKFFFKDDTRWWKSV